MGAIEDVRKVIQDLVAPELKSLQATIKGVDEASKLRDEALSAKIDSRFDALSEKMNLKFEHVLNEMKANQAMLIYTLNLDNRVKDIERKTAEPMHAT
ncbi:MAG TPA: hypothetical protein VFC39_02245 [Acidobacteriaceae bacterium]|nr:hypothetical protein [Acidobacteriaceae bacterium]